MNDNSDVDSEKTEAPDYHYEDVIDLREVLAGVVRKWYIWVLIPILCVAVVFFYYKWTYTPTYRLEGAVEVDYGNQVLNQVDMSIPPRRVLSQQLRSKDLLLPEIKRVYPNRDSQSQKNLAENLLAGMETYWDTSTQNSDLDTSNLNSPVFFSINTSQPDTVARAFQGLGENFESRYTKQLREQLQDKKQALEKRQQFLDENWQDWQTAWQDAVNDSFPDFIEPHLETARADFEEAATKSGELQRKITRKESRLATVKTLLEEEPPIYGYRYSSGIVSMVLGGRLSQSEQSNNQSASDQTADGITPNQLSDLPSEVLNDAYLDLRKERVNLQSDLSSLRPQVKQFKEQLKKRKAIQRDIQRLPTLQQQKNTLENREEFLSSNLTSLQSKLERIEYALTDLPEFIHVYPPQAPGKKLEGPPIRRNSVLAGAVTFLILFIGLIIYEVL